MDAADFLKEAVRLVPSGGWVMYESVPKAGLDKFDNALQAKDLQPCSSVRVFGTRAELRLEKEPGDLSGQASIIVEGEENDSEAVSCLCREQDYLLRGIPGKLIHREYFCEDESGFPRLVCDRAAGIDGGM